MDPTRCRTSRPKLQPDSAVAAHGMGRNQATPVDAPAPNRVHRLPFPRLASRPRQAGHRVKVEAAAMTPETPKIRISRQIPGAAGSNGHHQHGRSRGGETSFSAAGDFTSSGSFSRSRSGGNSCRTRWQARCSTGKHRLDGHRVERRCCCRAVPLKDARRQRRILECYPRNAAQILRSRVSSTCSSDLIAALVRQPRVCRTAQQPDSSRTCPHGLR